MKVTSAPEKKLAKQAADKNAKTPSIVIDA